MTSLVPIPTYIYVFYVCPGLSLTPVFHHQDGRRTCDGSLFAEAAAAVCAARPDGALAVGVNCSAPEDAVHLLTALDRRRVTLPLVVYPNSGELWVNGRLAGWGGGR